MSREARGGGGRGRRPQGAAAPVPAAAASSHYHQPQVTSCPGPVRIPHSLTNGIHLHCMAWAAPCQGFLPLPFSEARPLPCQSLASHMELLRVRVLPLTWRAFAMAMALPCQGSCSPALHPTVPMHPPLFCAHTNLLPHRAAHCPAMHDPPRPPTLIASCLSFLLFE